MFEIAIAALSCDICALVWLMHSFQALVFLHSQLTRVTQVPLSLTDKTDVEWFWDGLLQDVNNLQHYVLMWSDFKT